LETIIQQFTRVKETPLADDKKGCLAGLLSLFRTNRSGVEGAAASPDFEDPMPFHLRDDFLSPAEASFFRVLKGVVKDEFLIFPKVSLKDIFFVSRPRENRAYYNKIDRKHVDFLLCDAGSLKPVMGIELDDSSHQRTDRIERDELVESVFKRAGLPLRRIPARFAYSQEELEGLIRGTATTALQPSRSEPWDSTDPAPYCPACGEQMLLRTAQRGANAGNKFYGCPNYPRCREIIPLATG
jgi:hypothetical protein